MVLSGVILTLSLLGSTGVKEPSPQVLPLDVDDRIRALQDSNSQIREQAIKDLGQLERVSPKTIMQIVKICNDNRDEIARDAYRALEAIGGKAAPAIPYLTRVLLNEKYPSNCRAGNALSALGKSALPAVPALRKALMSKRVLTRKAAIETLGAVGAGAGPAVPKLFDMALHDKGGGFVWSIKDKACCAIAKIGTAGVPLLLDALKSPESQTREVATEVLYLMTSESAGSAKSAKESLEKALQDEDSLVRVFAALGYWNLSKKTDRVRPILMSVLHGYLEDCHRSSRKGTSRNWQPRDVVVVINGLPQLGAEAAPAIELLLDILQNANDLTERGLKLRTVETLGKLGHTARPAIPLLQKCATVPDKTMKEAARQALRKITVTVHGSGNLQTADQRR